MHPWIIARSPGAGEVMEASDIAALLKQRMPPDAVREVLADARPYREIAEACGMTYQAIAMIKSRRLHADVAFEGDIPRGARQSLDPEVVRGVLADPRAYDEIAAGYGLSYQMVLHIKNRRVGARVPFEGGIPRGAPRDDEKVRAIYLDPDDHGTAATKYGVTYTMVTNIRRRRSHETVTRGLTPPLRSRAPRQETLQEMEARHATERAALLRRGLR